MSGHITYNELSPELQEMIDSSGDNDNLDNYYNKTEVDNIAHNKVDKVEGKGLSSNDFTNEYKQKLDNLASAEPVDISGKVDKVEGKGLSSNDFTNEYKQKLDSLDTSNKGLSTNDFTDNYKTILDNLKTVEVSNSTTDTEDQGKALNSVQLNPNIEGTLAYKVEQLGNGLSDGMKKVADAITKKGVETQATDSLSTMANNILSIMSGGGCITLNALRMILGGSTSLPYEFYGGNAVVYRNEIHILGGCSSTTSHYKYDGSTWTSVSTLPYSFYYGGAVVYDDKIYLLGGVNNGYARYIWNGETWIQQTGKISSINMNFYQGGACVCKDTIFMIGTYDYMNSKYASYMQWYEPKTDNGYDHYFSKYRFYNGGVVTLNDKIHIFGGDANPTAHYSSEVDTSVTSSGRTDFVLTSTIPYSYTNKNCLVAFGNDIHIFGTSKQHYKWNESTGWTQLEDLANTIDGGAAVVFNGVIKTLGGRGITGEESENFKESDVIEVVVDPSTTVTSGITKLSEEIKSDGMKHIVFVP